MMYENIITCDRWLTTSESIRQVSNRFGMGISTLHYVIRTVCVALIETFQSSVIKFPSDAQEWKIVHSEFASLFGFPNVAGAVDGSHIPIKSPPPQRQRAYFNRKNWHSIVLQGTVRASGAFMDVYCGWPGSVGDGRIWENSSLGNKIHRIIPTGSFILADKAYALSSSLMTPYKRIKKKIEKDKKHYNLVHSQTRVVVETAFGALKMRWRRLQTDINLDLSFLPDIVVAACVLHNLCILKFDPLPEDDMDVYLEREREFAKSEVAKDVADIQRVLNLQAQGFPDVLEAAKGELLDFGTTVPTDLRDGVCAWLNKNKVVLP